LRIRRRTPEEWAVSNRGGEAMFILGNVVP
jgi:hypothetical protein